MDSQEVKDFQNAVYAFSNAIGGMIESAGMQALNQYRTDRGETIAYDEGAFNKLMEDRGLHYNALMKSIYDM